MIFTPEHCAMNVAGTKTNTRRTQKEGDYPVWDEAGERIVAVYRPTARPCIRQIKYRVGHTYANQPGRGKKANGRIRMLGIRRERLWAISSDDITREGLPLADFLKQTPSPFLARVYQQEAFERLWDQIHPRKDRVWVLIYEFVEGSNAA